MGHEQIGPLHFHGRGDAPRHPVLDALHAAGRLVIAERLRELCGTAELVDQLGVGMGFFGRSHTALHTTFKPSSNATCNNAPFNTGKIPTMTETTMHPTMARLYQAALELKNVQGQSAVARLLGATPQAIKNWEDRGVSKAGAITAQKALGCSATWVLDGVGHMTYHPGGFAVAAPRPSRSGGDVEIRQFEAGGGMGAGRLLLDDQPGLIKSWHVDHDWLRLNVRSYSSIENLCIVTGFGPSMRPMFNPGDPLLVDRGVKVADTDAVFFFRVGEHGFIKALQRIPTADGLILRAKSKNPDYDPFDIDQKTMDFEVLGKVLTVWKSEQF